MNNIQSTAATSSSSSHSNSQRIKINLAIVCFIVALNITIMHSPLSTHLKNLKRSTTLALVYGDGVDDLRLLRQSKDKTVLVTGGAGFIGSHVTKYCAEHLGMKVVVVDDLSGGKMSNVPRHDLVSFVQGDVKDALFLESLFSRFSFDYIYHLAAYTAIGLSPFIRSFNYRNNMIATTELLNFAVKSKIDCFVFSSSNAVYGEGQSQLETTVPQPEDPYGISKYASELDIRAAHRMFGLDSVILRLHNVYGPNQNAHDKYRNAIGIFMNQVQSGLPITIFGDGEQTRQLTYISDVAPIIAKAPLVRAAQNEIINVGSDLSYSLNTVAKQIQSTMGETKKITQIQHIEARKEAKYATLKDHSKLRLVFGKTDFVPLDKGLAPTASSFAQQILNNSSDTSAMNLRGLKIDLQRLIKVEVSSQDPESKCNPSTVAFLISGQFSRFIFRDNQGPLVTRSSSWWGCGKPVVDVYIALHRGEVSRPWTGSLSVPPYITDNVTITDIQQYYLEKRNATTVHVQFVDNEHMSAFDNDIMNQVNKRNIPSEPKDLIKRHYARIRPASRMFYMRHLAYAMALQQQKKYDVYVSQREDAFFYEPLNFTDMGYTTVLDSGPDSINLPGAPVKPRVIVEKWCKYGAYSDKIHIGNQLSMCTLFGKDRNEFFNLMMRFMDFGCIRGGRDPFQAEAFLQNLLAGVNVSEVDLKRVDMRYIEKTRCVPGLYYRCQPNAVKSVLSQKYDIQRCNN